MKTFVRNVCQCCLDVWRKKAKLNAGGMPVEKLCVSVLKVELRCFIGSLRQLPEEEAGTKVNFKAWHAHWQVWVRVQE